MMHKILILVFQAKYHFLVMPKRNIPNLRSLKTDDIKLLKYMEEKGREIAKRYSSFKLTNSIYNWKSLESHKIFKM